MGAKFQFPIKKVLNHLEHAFFNLFFVVGRFNVFANLAQTIFLDILFCSEEEFALPCSLCNILIDINSYQDPHFSDVVKKRAKRKIARSAKETDNGIQISYLRIVLQDTLKFFHQCIPFSIREEVGMSILFCAHMLT